MYNIVKDILIPPAEKKTTAIQLFHSCRWGIVPMVISFLALAAGLALAENTPLNGASARPFYVVAHGTNTLETAELALKHGANALEMDLIVLPSGSHLARAPYTPSPTDIVVYHDNLFATPYVPLTLTQHLDGIHKLAIAYPVLALIVFDIKSSAALAVNGPKILDAVHRHLNFDGVNVNVIFSVADRSDGAVFDNILDKLGEREGVMIDEEDDANETNQFFFDRGFFGNIGYGDGSLWPGFDLPRAIDLAAFNRTSTGFPKAVTYVYVLNSSQSEDSYINRGVDGIIPDAFFSDPGYNSFDPSFIDDLLVVVRQHPEIRLATRDDNPFQPANEAYGLEIVTSDLYAAGSDGDLTFTLNGSRGQATITVNTGEKNLIYENKRMESGNTDHVTIPSADLGRISSITIHNDGGLGDGWHLASIKVSSARYIGPNINHNNEYIATFNDWIKIGETKTVALSKVKSKKKKWGRRSLR
ncbi:MAG: PLAT/LH2 domain-containing protein [Pseudomonadota bacterium]